MTFQTGHVNTSRDSDVRSYYRLSRASWPSWIGSNVKTKKAFAFYISQKKEEKAMVMKKCAILHSLIRPLCTRR